MRTYLRIAINVIFILFSCISAKGQLLNGIVSDAKTHEGLPYVNVGILHREKGTVSSMDGSFLLDRSACRDDDTIRISILGYKPFMMQLGDFNEKMKQSAVVLLERSTLQLKEVKVKATKLTSHEEGNIADDEGFTAGFVSNDLGSELVVHIRNKNKYMYLDKFSFFVAKNIYDSLFFRLNIYAFYDGTPQESILNDNIYFKTTAKKGWVTVDLSKYNIESTKDIAIGLEWIRNLNKEGNVKGLFFSCKAFRNNSYYRKTSQQEWKRVPMVGIGFTATVKD